MRVALIEARDPNRPAQVYMPIGLAYLQSWLQRNDRHQVKLIRTLDEMWEWAPQIVGISAVSPNFPYAVELAETIRQRSAIPIILGGPHITSAPDTLPKPCVAGVRGEGEITTAALLELLEQTPRPSAQALANIFGIVFHDSNSPTGTTCTLPRALIDRIDEIPAPDRSWAADNSPLWSFSSRGCPFHCTFCSTASFWSGYRLHSPEYVTRELKAIMQSRRQQMHIFMDDLFVANIDRLREMQERFASELPYTIPLMVTVRADLVTPEVCRVLSAMNVRFCHLGLESGSDRVLNYLKANTTTIASNQRALDLLAEANISAVGSFIIGAPNEEEEDIAATWKFIDANLQSGKLQSFSFGPLVAFPGTKIWDYGCERGIIAPEHIDWRSLDIDLRAFNLDKYTMFSPLGRQRFDYWFRRFHKRWQEQLNLT